MFCLLYETGARLGGAQHDPPIPAKDPRSWPLARPHYRPPFPAASC